VTVRAVIAIHSFPSGLVEVFISLPAHPLLVRLLAVGRLLFGIGRLLSLVVARLLTFRPRVIGIREILVGLQHILKLLLVLFFTCIWMVLLGELVKLCFELLLGDGWTHTEHLIV